MLAREYALLEVTLDCAAAVEAVALPAPVAREAAPETTLPAISEVGRLLVLAETLEAAAIEEAAPLTRLRLPWAMAVVVVAKVL